MSNSTLLPRCIRKKNNGRQHFEHERNSKFLLEKILGTPLEETERRRRQVEVSYLILFHVITNTDECAHTRASRCIRRERFRKTLFIVALFLLGFPHFDSAHTHILSFSLSLSLTFFLSLRLSLKTRF